MHQLLFYLLLISLAVGICKDLPPGFQKCNRSNDKFSDCLKSAIQDAIPRLRDGIPDYRLLPLDPLLIESVTFAAPAGPVQIEQKYKNLRLHQLSQGKVSEVRATLTDKEMHLEFVASFEKIITEGNYELNGKVLVLPVVGSGRCRVECDKLNISVALSAEAVKKRGKTYMPIKDAKIVMSSENVVFNFTNLFNGDEQLGARVNKLLNDNQRDVFNEIKPGYEQFWTINLKEMVNCIFSKVPYDTIFPL